MARKSKRITYPKGAPSPEKIRSAILAVAKSFKIEASDPSEDLVNHIASQFHEVVATSQRHDGPREKELKSYLKKVTDAARSISTAISPSNIFPESPLIEREAYIMIRDRLTLDDPSPDQSAIWCEIQGMEMKLSKLAEASEAAINYLSALPSEQADGQEYVRREGGRPRKDGWKKLFTQVCISICEHLRIKPTLSKPLDEDPKGYGGNLFRVARLFEESLLSDTGLTLGGNVNLYRDLTKFKKSLT